MREKHCYNAAVGWGLVLEVCSAEAREEEEKRYASMNENAAVFNRIDGVWITMSGV